ncbi:MAG TPA: DUF1840 domain-containing protein [Burkholderiales bacterium]|nr:DUF1840 domain-containing protein [Burkholderiales bacterium]
MLVQFQTPAYATITMFGEVAKTLLKMMGMTGDIPGAINAEDVPAALERLKQAVAALPKPTEEENPRGQEESQHVDLGKRAFPLIQLLEAAAKKEKHVMWEVERGPIR